MFHTHTHTHTHIYIHTHTHTYIHTYTHTHTHIQRLGMFPFKVQLFQGCKSETEPINKKSVVQHVVRYQVLLAAYYEADPIPR
jgi:hypothetical protein